MSGKPVVLAAGICAALWLASMARPVRVAVGAPLVVSCENPAADAAYVLAGGNALIERLSAAADLFHMRSVPRIILARDGRTSKYNFKAKASWTAAEWAAAYLEFFGVPEKAVVFLDVDFNAAWGTLNEARSVAGGLPKDVKSLVLVTSPVHTRRSLLAFRRSLPAGIRLSVYPACSAAESVEFNDSLVVEYLKLIAYWVLA